MNQEQTDVTGVDQPDEDVEADVDRISEQLSTLQENIERVIVGKPDVVEHTIIAFVAGGHLLIEDVPGVAKTMLARALARSIQADFQRIQCTPDLMPSDVSGVSVFNKKSHEFEFRPGPVFTNILLADEINRATPRTQSALLEAMEEGQVTVDDETHSLNELFFVIATQNPVEHQGTYPLPEAQLDRFLMMIDIGYPEKEEEIEMMQQQKRRHPIEELEPVLDKEEILSLQEEVREVYVHPSVLSYITDIVNQTREEEHLDMGSSPRGSIFLMRAAQVKAAGAGREYVSPDDVKQLAPSVLSHRIMVRPESSVSDVQPRSIINRILSDVPIPVDVEE